MYVHLFTVYHVTYIYTCVCVIVSIISSTVMPGAAQEAPGQLGWREPLDRMEELFHMFFNDGKL